MVVAGFSMALMSAIYNIGKCYLQELNALGICIVTAQVGARMAGGTFPYAGTCAWNECLQLIQARTWVAEIETESKKEYGQHSFFLRSGGFFPWFL